LKKKILKLLKILTLSVIALVVILIITFYFSLHRTLPKGAAGIEADSFALQIQKAVKHEQYLTTNNIQWSFRNKHHYIWNKKQNKVNVKWDDHMVNLDLKQPEKSTLANSTISSKEKKDLIKTALAYFNNDSFWIVAPHKLFDPGTTREIVTLEDNSKALLVTYSAGGTTPGDSYLWKVDKNYLPKSYQMWVSIIPIGGIEATWDGWTTTQSGAYLATKHELLGFGIPISNLKAW